MKVIDLLNKIAKGEEVPKEIRFRGTLCSFDKDDKDYYCEEYSNIVWFLIDTSNNMNEVLDTELEIIEEVEDKEYVDITTINLCHKDDAYFIDTLNDLIKNQKKIIEQLKNKD